MIYSVVDNKGREITPNKLRNEIIYAFKTDKTSLDYEGETYHIKKMVSERVGYKKISVEKD